MAATSRPAKPRAVELGKGASLSLLFFVPLGVLAWALVGRDGDLPGLILVGWCLLTVVGLVSIAVRFWNRSRWLAYGALTSLVVGVTLAIVLAILLLMAIGSAIKG